MGSAAVYADQLVVELRGLGAEVSEHFRRQFLRHASRLGPDSYADLGAMMAAECLEMKRDGHSLDARATDRALDRIRQRLTRELKGPARTEPLGDRLVVDPKPTVEQQVIGRDTLGAVLASLDISDLQVLDLWLSGRSSDETAGLLGVRPDAFRKRVSRILHRIREQPKRPD